MARKATRMRGGIIKKTSVVIGIVVVAVLAWLAAGTTQKTGSGNSNQPALRTIRPEGQSEMTTAETTAERTTVATSTGPVSSVTGVVVAPPASEVPIHVTGTAETGTTGPPAESSAEGIFGQFATVGPMAAAVAPPLSALDLELPRGLDVPVAGVPRSAMRDMFDEVRGNKRHEAIDILAPRGTLVIAAGDGLVKKLFTSVPGGLTVYQFDPPQRFCYYYAHLDAYAPGLHEGQQLRRGELVGYVGTSGNAPKDTPHLHFAVIRLDADKRWWKGTYVNPYPLLTDRFQR